MLTRLQKAATIIALALCFAGAIGMEVWQASYPPQSPSQRAAAPYSNKTYDSPTNESPEQAIARYNGDLVVFTAILATATIILAVATVGLGIGTIFQIRLARAEFIQTHRPQIILRDVWMENNKQEILYILVNIGGTKATVVESWILAEFIPRGRFIRPLRSYGHDDLGRLTFAAGEMKDLTYRVPGEISAYIMFPDAMRIGAENEPPMIGHFYFTGTILYSDDAGNKRRSVFRRRWDSLSEGFDRADPDLEYAD